MAEKVGFYSPETARMVLLVIEELKRSGFLTKSGNSGPPRWTENGAIIAYTPSGGIAARSGTTAGSASCAVYRVDDAGELVAVNDNQGNAASVTVYHIGAAAIGGSRYIQAKRASGQWVADMEDCG